LRRSAILAKLGLNIGNGNNGSAVTWKTKDGWIVYTTETREPAISSVDRYRNDYAIVAYPKAFIRRR
jgi:hypothetical protein